jgi:hypothetical protein
MRFVCSLQLGKRYPPSLVASPRAFYDAILSEAVVSMKSRYQAAVNESLPSKIRGLIPACTAETPEKRSAAY